MSLTMLAGGLSVEGLVLLGGSGAVLCKQVDEVAGLLTLREVLPRLTNLANWTSLHEGTTIGEARLKGVTIEKDHVTEITLDYLELEGKHPRSITHRFH